MRLKLQFVPIFAALLAVFLLSLNLGRSRQVSSAEAAAPSEEASLPFHHRNAANDLVDPAPSPTPTQEVTVPAGTELEVCMQSSLSSATALAGEHFEAILQEPLVIDGKVIAPSGANVTGRVVEVRHSGVLHKAGYLRITLMSLNLKGQEIPVLTSSFLVQGASNQERNRTSIGGITRAATKKDAAIGMERQLTFRLTQPLVTHS